MRNGRPSMMACLSKSILEQLRVTRPAIRTAGVAEGRGRGSLHGPIRSVADALAFERRGVWQIGWLGSLSYTDVRDVSGLGACRKLHTLLDEARKNFGILVLVLNILVHHLMLLLLLFHLLFLLLFLLLLLCLSAVHHSTGTAAGTATTAAAIATCALA